MEAPVRSSLVMTASLITWSKGEALKSSRNSTEPLQNPQPKPGGVVFDALTSTTSFSRSPLMSSLSFCSFSRHSALCTSRLRSRSGPGECRFASSKSALSSFRLLEEAERGEDISRGCTPLAPESCQAPLHLCYKPQERQASKPIPAPTGAPDLLSPSLCQL